MTWRAIARPIIAKCIADNTGDEKAIKRALRDAYPFGQRSLHPYKVWLDEIKRQMGNRHIKKQNEKQMKLWIGK